MPRGPILGSLLCLCVLSPVRAVSQSVDTVVISLEDAERRALERHPLLEPASVEVELAEAQSHRARRARYLPEFNLRNVWGPIPRQRGEFTETGVLFSPDSAKGIKDLRWFTDVQLQLLQPIHTFGKAGNRIDAAEHGVEASRAGLETTRADVLLQVRELYWGLLLGLELQDVARDVLDRVDEAEATLEERYEQGDATQNDLFKFRIFRYEAYRRTREVEARTREAEAGLRAALGLDEGTTVRPADEALEPEEVTLDSLSAYMEAALESRPELARLRAGIAARRSLAAAEEADRWPNLFAGAEVRFNAAPSRFDPDNPFWDDQTNFGRAGVVVGFDWDLNFMHHGDQAEVSRLEARRLEAQRAPLEEQVRIQVREAWLTADRARQDVEQGEEALQASENWLRAELQTYDLGLGDIEDVIDAFRANAEMRTEQLRNVAELNTALAELSRRVGRDVRP